MVGFPLFTGILFTKDSINETRLSTVEQEETAQDWLSCQDVDRGRAGGHSSASPKGPGQTQCLEESDDVCFPWIDREVL